MLRSLAALVSFEMPKSSTLISSTPLLLLCRDPPARYSSLRSAPPSRRHSAGLGPLFQRFAANRKKSGSHRSESLILSAEVQLKMDPSFRVNSSQGTKLKKLFVGNLPWSATEGDVASLFADVGEVLSVRVVADRETGRSRGFAFVELDDEV